MDSVGRFFTDGAPNENLPNANVEVVEGGTHSSKESGSSAASPEPPTDPAVSSTSTSGFVHLPVANWCPDYDRLGIQPSLGILQLDPWLQAVDSTWNSEDHQGQPRVKCA